MWKHGDFNQTLMTHCEPINRSLRPSQRLNFHMSSGIWMAITIDSENKEYRTYVACAVTSHARLSSRFYRWSKIKSPQGAGFLE